MSDDPESLRAYWQENLLVSQVVGVGLHPREVAREEGVLVVARGGFTGSLHTIADAGARMFGHLGDPVQCPLLVVEAAVVLRHTLPSQEEVARTTIAPGTYAVVLWETDARYDGPPFLRPKKHGSALYIERPSIACLVGVEPEMMKDAAPAAEPSNRIELLELSLGERAWLEGSAIRVLEDRARNRIYFAESGGVMVYVRNAKRETIGLPHAPFRIVWP